MATYKFRRLLIFATFDPLIGGFIQVCPYVILVLYNTFVISLFLSLYKLSHACNQINFLSFNQSVRHEASSSLLLVIFSSSPFTFLHYLGSQTPLDDDKSRDAWLIPPDPSRGRPLGVVFRLSCMFSCSSCLCLRVFVPLLLTIG